MPDFISVHVPKIAGTSLRQLLVRHYGADDVRLDYDDRVPYPSSEFNRDRSGFVRRFQAEHPTIRERCVHGHFWPMKYSHIRAPMITFLRHPIDRTFSGYFFLRKKGWDDHEVWNAIGRERASVLDFASHPVMRWFYTRTFFGDVDMSRFVLIGATERHAAGLIKLGELFGVQSEGIVVNEMDERFYDQREEMMSDRRLLAALNDILSDDIRFYESHTEHSP